MSANFLLEACVGSTLLLFIVSWAYQQISKRRHAETILKQERDFTTAILDTGSALVVVLDPEGRIVRFNRSCEQMTGYRLEDVRQQQVEDLLILPEEVESVKAVFASLRSNQAPITHENYWMTRNGDRRLVIWSSTVVQKPSGEIDWIVSTGVDITDRKQAEAELVHLAAIVESSDDAIIGTTLDGKITSWNLGAEKTYGYSAAEAQGQRISSLLVSLTELDDPLHLLETAKPDVYLDPRETQHLRKDGKLIDVSLTVSLMKDPAGNITGLSMIARDVSDRRTVERMKDEFISIVSHELRTPLCSLRGSLGLLMTGKLGTLSDKGQRMLEIAINNTDRLICQISGILNLERLESGQPILSRQGCSLADIMQQAVATTQAQATKAGITLVVAPASFTLHADAKRIVQVLANLLSNAIKFSPAGSTVWLNAELATPYSPQAPPSVLISVKDQGQGIPSDQLETIFERFRQVDASDSRRKGGTGLGLTICRSIIQGHDGSIWGESILGEGSTFYVTLPVQPAVELSPLSEDPLIAASNCVILVSEQFLAAHHVLHRSLEQQGCTILTVSSSEEAIAQAAILYPTPILLELDMLNLNDWEAACMRCL